MKDKYKDLTIKFSNLLQEKSFQFMMRNIPNGQETSDILNLILSAHISSCFTCMRLIASEHTEHTKKVNQFIKTLTEVIENLEPIEKVELEM